MPKPLPPAAFAAAILAFAPAPGAWGQPSAEPRNGDVRGGVEHQPTQAEVVGRERAAGILPPDAERRDRADTVERTAEEMLREEREEAGRLRREEAERPVLPPERSGR